MKKLYIGALLILSGMLFSQKVNEIYIVNENSKLPVASLSVTNEDGSFQSVSDENGLLNLKDFNGNTLYISGIGYEKQSLDLRTIRIDKNVGYVYVTPKIVSIEEVKITANAKNNIFQTISDLDIHLRPINNSQEILRTIPGLFIGQHAGGGKAEQLFIRGFDIDHGTDISLFVDGIPVNMPSHAHGQGYADLHFLIPEFVDKVDFNKGPYFADKGNFTTAGYVDFRTKNFLENNFVKVEAGQFSSYRGVLGLNLLKNKKEMKDQSLIIGSELYFTDGYFENPQDFNRFNFLLKYYGKLNENNILTASTTALSSKWNASGQIPDRAIESGQIGWFGAIDPNEGGKTSRYNLNLNLKSYLKNGATWNNQLYYSKYKFELYSNFTFFLNDSENGDQIRQHEDRNLIGFNSTYEKTFEIGKIRTQTSIGTQIRYDDVNELELSHTADRITILERLKYGNVDETNLGFFWTQKIMLSPKFDITPAVRFDHFNNQYQDLLLDQNLKANSSIASPKLRFDYRMNDKVQLYTYVGRGFHSNDTRVVVLEGGKATLPPAWGSDIGGVFKIGKKLILQTALWYLWLDQEFVYVGDEAVVEAGGKTQRIGIDVSARYELVKNLYADVNLNLAKPKALDTPKAENYIPLAPKVVSTGGITYRKATGFNGSVRYRYMGDRPANEDNSVVAEGYTVFDAVLNYTAKKWEVGISIQNLFDVKWKETQFDTESRLYNEAEPVSEIHFTPGTPFFGKLSFTYFF
ncbi:MAG: TonB-dependent receptor [Chryseobacterium sp.]|nr:MAG: TonB-dependent receptor [Chryseobacterium sp.]